MGQRHGTDRRPVAVAITTDGRRVSQPLQAPGLFDLSPVAFASDLFLGLVSLIGLITGSRRETGGTRRNERR